MMYSDYSFTLKWLAAGKLVRIGGQRTHFLYIRSFQAKRKTIQHLVAALADSS